MSVKLQITITEGPERGKSYDFTGGIVRLGRNKGDIQLTDKKISGRHCQFVLDGTDVWLEDLGSTNGTFVGSRRVEDKLKLNNLDVVTVGLTRLTVSIVEELSSFKKRNALDSIAAEATIPEPVSELSRIPESVSAMTTKAAPANSVPDEPVYRDTGIQRITELIDDELKSFSKWDHPSPETKPGTPGKSIPRIQVILSARKAPEGVSQITCSQDVTTVGRKGVDIRINDLDLSRKHSAIEIVGGKQAFIRDLASTNGTYVNGTRITYQEIKAGDLIQIGQSVFEVFIQQGK